VSQFPPGWARATIGDLGAWSGGGTPSKSNPAFWTDGDIPWVSPKDMKVPHIADAEDHITEAAVLGSATSVVPPGSVLAVIRSGILRRTFPVAVTMAAVALNQDLKALKPAVGINPRYVAWWLRRDEQSILHECSKDGTTVDSIDFPRLLKRTIPLAPSAEQERIVLAIEEQFSRVDAGVVPLESALRRVRAMRNAIRFAAVGGRLVVQDPSDEPAAELIKRARPTGRFRGTSALPAQLPDLPRGWTWAPMGRLARRVTVGHVGPMKDRYVPEGVPFLRSQNVRADRFEPRGILFIPQEFHEQLRKSRLEPGDLVVVRSGNVGTACVVPDSLGEANCADLVIIQGPEAIDPSYGALYMNSLAQEWIRAGRVGVALTHFNTRSVAELPVPVPPYREQLRIVEAAQRLMSIADALETALVSAMRRSRQLRSSILATAFSGQLVPQDPQEESASVLLDRVAAERVQAEVHQTLQMTMTGPRTRRTKAPR
jgi:type I restriction enzyme S subunit